MDNKQTSTKADKGEQVTRADRVAKLNRKIDGRIEQRRESEPKLGPPYPEASPKRNVR